ncbi:hypothetical protein P9112_002937 [Eukaryota sp. TZLM1-RC]
MEQEKRKPRSCDQLRSDLSYDRPEPAHKEKKKSKKDKKSGIKCEKVCHNIELGCWSEDVAMGEPSIEERIVMEQVAREKVVRQPMERITYCKEAVSEDEMEQRRESTPFEPSQ